MIDPILLNAVTDNIGLTTIWESYYGFVAIALFILFMIGLASRSLVIGSWSAFLGFVHIALEVDDQFFEEILITVLVLVIVGYAFKLWRSEAIPIGGGT